MRCEDKSIGCRRLPVPGWEVRVEPLPDGLPSPAASNPIHIPKPVPPTLTLMETLITAGTKTRSGHRHVMMRAALLVCTTAIAA